MPVSFTPPELLELLFEGTMAMPAVVSVHISPSALDIDFGVAVSVTGSKCSFSLGHQDDKCGTRGHRYTYYRVTRITPRNC